MSFSNYNPYDRYKNRLFYRFSAFGVVFMVMICSVLVGYFFGKEHTLQEGVFMKGQEVSLSREKDILQDTITELRAEARTANLRYEELQKNFQDKVPDGPSAELITLVNKQLEEGADPQRLAFLIRSGRPPRNCTDPDTQRFIVSTPAYSGTDSQANIGQGAIVIKASGSSARNDKGENEAWYDPSKAVNLEFTIKGGRTEKKRGVMPLTQSIVLEGREYRFTIAEGARSFAKATYDSCDYP